MKTCLTHALGFALCATLLSGCGAATDEPEDAALAIPSVVNIYGALVRPYSASSLEEFSKGGYVRSVVVGTVTDAKVRVSEPGSEVQTLVTLKVDSANPGNGSEVITFREPGGVVTLDQVRKDFEGRVDPTVLDERADEKIDYRAPGWAHSVVGQRQLVFLSGTAEDPFSAAHLVDREGRFVWDGTPVNEKWVGASYTEAQARDAFGLN